MVKSDFQKQQANENIQKLGEYLIQLKNSGTLDGCVVTFPFIPNPRPDRMAHVDLSKLVSNEG